MKDGESWRRLLAEEWRSRWACGLQRLKDLLKGTYPTDWRSFCIDQRDEDRILNELCNNHALDKLLPTQKALQDGLATLGKANASLGTKQLTDGELAAFEALVQDSKIVFGIRAASTVSLVKIPSACNAKSKQAFLRECKRLLAALQIQLPAVVLNKMEEAAAA